MKVHNKRSNININKYIKIFNPYIHLKKYPWCIYWHINAFIEESVYLFFDFESSISSL